MLRFGLAGENPFEGSANDVPISNISRRITRDVLQLIDEDSGSFPEPFENINDVQMQKFVGTISLIPIEKFFNAK